MSGKLPPEEKGWKLVKDILQNDEQYYALRQGFHITLTGSNQLQYILYPNGHVVKLAESKPVLGNMDVADEYVDADYLATIIAWIRFNAKNFERRWGCGNLELDDTMTVQEQETVRQINNLTQAQMRQRQELLQRIQRDEGRWSDINWIGSASMIISLVIVIVVGLIIVSNIDATVPSGITPIPIEKPEQSFRIGDIIGTYNDKTYTLLTITPYDNGYEYSIKIGSDTNTEHYILEYIVSKNQIVNFDNGVTNLKIVDVTNETLTLEVADKNTQMQITNDDTQKTLFSEYGFLIATFPIIIMITVFWFLTKDRW